MLTAGPEIDLAVAKACGFDFDVDPHGCVLRYGESSEWFEPSTDLNDAFLAAERFELFNYNGGFLSLCKNNAEGTAWGFVKNKYGPSWEWWMWPNDNGGRSGVQEPTPALAICAGILKLSEVGSTANEQLPRD